MNEKQARLNLLAGIIILAVTGAFFLSRVLITKGKLVEFNAALGKESEVIGFGQAASTLLNDNKLGTFDENVKFENAQYKTGVIEIKEKMFLSQTNDIYLNADDYLGKTIKLEGLFKREQYGGTDYCYVLRYGPGCCGYDGSAGFEVIWEGSGYTYPKEDAWVEAAGILKVFNDGGIYIALSKLTVLDRRGAEFVRQ